MRWALGVLLAIAIVTACSGDDDDAESTDTTAVEATAEPCLPPSTRGADRAESADGSLVLESTSTRAGLVTAGDVLLTLSGPAAVDATVTRERRRRECAVRRHR